MELSVKEEVMQDIRENYRTVVSYKDGKEWDVRTFQIADDGEFYTTIGSNNVGIAEWIAHYVVGCNYHDIKKG